MTTFKLSESHEIVCEWKKTRNGFKHEATLLINGIEAERVKCCYLNRTWEQYEYQTVMHKLLEKSRELTKEQKDAARAYLDGADGYSGAGNDRAMSGIRSIAAFAMLGEVLSNGDRKAENDWKARMLKAGLGTYGLTMPEDWDSLDEETKSERLNAVIAQLTK